MKKLFICTLITMMLLSFLPYNVDLVSAKSEEGTANELYEEKTIENIAVGKLVTTSSNWNDTQNGEKAVDGITGYNSSWVSKTGNNEWLLLDLGKEYTISKWILHFHSAYSNDSVKLKISNDGETWQDVDSVSGSESIVVDSRNKKYDRSVEIPFTTRYVKVLIGASIPLANITEIELYSEVGQSESDEVIVPGFKGISNSNHSSTFINDGVSVLIDPELTISGIIDELGGASVVINNFNIGDQLNFTNTDKISGVYNQENGVLILNGQATEEEYQEALSSVSYSTTSSNITDRTFTFNLGSSLSYNNHYYEFIEASGISWTNARIAAEAKTFFGRKGYLATVTSQGENEFIKEKTSGNGWIGASDYYTELNRVVGNYYTDQAQAEGQWYWVTGPEAGTQFWQGGSNGSSVDGGYENWYVNPNGVRGEPNNSGGEHYAHILGTNGAFWNNNDTAGYGKWNDFPDSLPEHVEGYVLEYGGMEGDNEAITISTSKVSKFKVSELTPLEKVNAAKKTGNLEDVIAALKDPGLGLTLPEGFEDWEQFATNIRNLNEEQVNIEQIQFILNFDSLLMGAFEEAELEIIKNKITNFFEMLSDSGYVFPNNSEYDKLSEIAQSFLSMSDIDQEIIAYSTKLHYLKEQKPGNQIFVELMSSIPNYKSINRVNSNNEIVDVLTALRLLQMESEQFNIDLPEYLMDDFKLNLDKLSNLSFADVRYQDLAQWMLDKRPASGYEDFGEIQATFDLFFKPVAPNVTVNDNTNRLIDADDTMEYSTDGGTSWTTYNPVQAPTFTGNVTVQIRVKASGDTSVGLVTTVIFTKNPASVTNPSPTATPIPTSPTTEQIVVDVDGENGTNLTKTPVIRTTEPNGTVKDKVAMTETLAKEIVVKAKQQGVDTARIVIPDTNDKVAEVNVDIPKSALKQLNAGNLKLEIVTDNAVISIPTKSISGFAEDLYFRIVPMKTEQQRKLVEERAKKEEMIQNVAQNQTVQVLGRPMEIETNMQSREVSIVLPLKDSLPSDAKKRQEILDNLGVFIEHSDGTKELMQGKLVKMKDGSEGIEFMITKFSTFTLIYMDGWKEYQDDQKQIHKPYINGVGEGIFRPDADVTRAQMAKMLARNLLDIDSSNQLSYKDVSKTHWAYNDILKAKNAGIMVGTSTDKFKPEGTITRAQMATIAYRWIEAECKNDSSSFENCGKISNYSKSNYKDVPANHWAVQAISFMKVTEIMVGYNDGNFNPEEKLTRAQAVKVLNRIFKRGPLTESTTSTFKDVPTTHWAFEEIEEAAREHSYNVNADGKEVLKK